MDRSWAVGRLHLKPSGVSLVENSLALGFYGLHLWHTPNPFKAPNPTSLDGLSGSPDDFYAVTAVPPTIEFRNQGFKKGAFRARFSFPSTYLSPHAINNTVHGQANLRGESKSRAALIFVHGHTMTHYNLLEWYARPAVQMGYDVYFFELPYHMERAPLGTWSGQYSLNSDIHG